MVSRRLLAVLSVLLLVALTTSAHTTRVQINDSNDEAVTPAAAGARVNTANMQLRQVQVLVRHGDRTPTMPIKAHPIDWFCDESRVLAEDDQGAAGVSLHPDRLFRLAYLEGIDHLHGNCSAGQLTSLGYSQHVALGQRMARQYVQTGFLSPTLSMSEVYVRSTSIPRTQASAQGFLQGMYPPTTPAGGAIPLIPIHLVDDDVDPMHINQNVCPRVYEAYVEMFLHSSPARTHLLELIAPYTFEIMKIFQTDDPLEGIIAFDNLKCRTCHNLPYPPGVTQNMYNALEKAFNDFTQLEFNATSFSLSPFYTELLQNMQAVVRGDPKQYKFRLYSGHDTSVGPLLVALGAYDGIWPPYASDVTMELLQDPADSQFYVHVTYRGNDLPLPACGNSALCTFAAFQKAITRVIPADFAQACKLKNPLLLDWERYRPAPAGSPVLHRVRRP